MTTLKKWERPYFQVSENDAEIFYVAFGKPPEKWDISGLDYRLSGIPDGIKISKYGPSKHPETIDRFRAGYLWDELGKEKPELAAAISEQTECLIIRGSLSDPKTLNYFRDIIGLIQWLFDSGIKGVFDPHAFLWWSPEEWDKVFQTAEANPHAHVMILKSPESDKMWLHTRGMRKFGRPDISVRGCPTERVEDGYKLINRFVEWQALGAVIPEGKEVKVAGLPSGMICKHKRNLDDPAFNNVHFEMVWPD